VKNIFTLTQFFSVGSLHMKNGVLLLWSEPYFFEHLKVIGRNTGKSPYFLGILFDTHKEGFLISRNETYFCAAFLMNSNRRHIPLGEIISNRRKELELSRVALSKLTGISDNSLIKYEKAGMDGGQYPPANKLAKICFHLSLSTSEALLSCLDPDDFKQTHEKFDADNFTADSYELDVLTHPAFKLMDNENHHLAIENSRMRTILRFLVLEEGNWSEFEKIKKWLNKRLAKQFSTYDEIETYLLAKGAALPLDLGDFQLDTIGTEQDETHFSYLPTSDDLYAELKDQRAFSSPERLSALKGPAGDKRKAQLTRAIEIITEYQESSEDPDQSPNSPGSSENK